MILAAFARQGHLRYEPELEGTRPDLVFEGSCGDREVRLLADIVAVSDFGIHEKNPVWFLFEKGWDLAIKVGVDFSAIGIEVGDNFGSRIPNGPIN